jgi:hypothetical protein
MSKYQNYRTHLVRRWNRRKTEYAGQPISTCLETTDVNFETMMTVMMRYNGRLKYFGNDEGYEEHSDDDLAMESEEDSDGENDEGGDEDHVCVDETLL